MNRKDEQTPARFNNSKEKKRRLLYGGREKKNASTIDSPVLTSFSERAPGI